MDEPVKVTIEFHDETTELTDRLRTKVEGRVHRLARGHRDMTGVSVAASLVSGATRQPEYRVRVVIYHKLGNVAAACEANEVSGALREALDAVERQVRVHRERTREKNRARRRDAAL